VKSTIYDSWPDPYRSLIGHRGAAALAPENTFSGFRKAASIGLNWVEFDIQLCSTGEWIVFHDYSLERTTNGHGLVNQTSYDKLKVLDAGSWFDPQFKDERIPLLIELLPILLQLKLYPNIEIKGEEPVPLDGLVNLLKILNTSWPKTLSMPLISSFNETTLIRLRSIDPTIFLGYLVHEATESDLALVKARNWNSLHTHYQKLSSHFVHKALQLQIPILAHTVNDPIEIKRLLGLGVHSVFSDMTQEVLSCFH
jgi:glycerophosphoryl diester phosphodiesterase